MVALMARRKTSIYVDENLWREFKRRATARGTEVSTLLEEIIRDELMEGISDALLLLAGSEDYQLDFEPVEPSGPVSELVRELRDEREGHILRQ